jgi:hypothetical protein
MCNRARGGVAGVTGLMALAFFTAPAGAVEYKLQVTSLFSSAYVYYLSANELENGASGPGLDRLESSIDRGDVPGGVVLWDRRVQPVRETIGRAWGGSRIIPQVTMAGSGDAPIWDTITWDGKPGERSVWVVVPVMRRIQEAYNVALRGNGPLRNFQPYAPPMNGSKVTVPSVPLNYLWFHEERGNVWDKFLARSIDLRDGIGAVVGVNTNPLFPDQVYIVVSHAEQPATYKAVLLWRERTLDRELPGMQNPVIVR